MGRPVNAQHGFLMVPRWPSSVDNAWPASLPPRLAWGGIPPKIHKTKELDDCNPIKECGKKQAQKENYKN